MLLRMGRDTLLSRGYTPGSCDRLERIVDAVKHFEMFLTDDWKPRGDENEAKKLLAALTRASAEAAFHARYNQFRLAQEVVDSEKISLRLSAYRGTARLNSTLGTLRSGLEKSIREDLESTIAAIHERNYAAAADTVEHALKALREVDGCAELPILRTPEDIDQWTVARARDDGGRFGAALCNTAGALELAISAYRRAMYLDIQRGEAEHVGHDYVPLSKRVMPTEQRPLHVRMKRAVLTYHFTSELTRFLSSHQQEKSFKNG